MSDPKKSEPKKSVKNSQASDPEQEDVRPHPVRVPGVGGASGGGVEREVVHGGNPPNRVYDEADRKKTG